jgi:F0F1-type ATP synthase assembly protein I
VVFPHPLLAPFSVLQKNKVSSDLSRERDQRMTKLHCAGEVKNYRGEVMPIQNASRSAYTLIFFQASFAAVIAVWFLAWGEFQFAISAALAGLVSVIANVFFTRFVFSIAPTQPAQVILGRFYWAELLKLLLTAGLFCMIIKFINIAAVPFFAVYSVLSISHGLLGLCRHNKVVLR